MNQMVRSYPSPELKLASNSKSASRPRKTAAEPRTNDPERTREAILRAAVMEFGEKGLAGARIDAIAAATQTSKRMIYYYFGSKDGLYLAALEQSYAGVRDREARLQLDDMDPETALRCLVTVMFDHHLANENYIRIVMSENMNRGRYLAQSTQIQELNRPAITLLRKLYDRGVAGGVFRPGLDATDIHASISALSFFNVSNRHTFGLIFQQDNCSPTFVANRRENIVQMILRYVKKA
jgi:AcrR family transcriptional regulator